MSGVPYGYFRLAAKPQGGVMPLTGWSTKTAQHTVRTILSSKQVDILQTIIVYSRIRRKLAKKNPPSPRCKIIIAL